MTRDEIVNYVCTKTQNLSADDITACQGFVKARYELIYNAELWKDALAVVPVPFDPTNADNAEGIVLLPEIINRVVAMRTIFGASRIQGLEHYFRIDFDAFCNRNANFLGLFVAASEYSILSPIWFVWRGMGGLTVSAPADAAPVAPSQIPPQFKISWRDETGKQFVQQVSNGSYLPTTVPAGANVIPAGAIYSTVATGIVHYIGGGLLTVGQAYLVTPGINEPFSTFTFVADTVTLAITFNSQISGQAVTATCQSVTAMSRLEIESLFKPVTNGNVALLNSANFLAPAVTRSPSYQRLRLFSIPTQPMILNVLGKRPCIPLDYGTEVPLIRNLDNVLIAFATAEMLERARQYGKAQAKNTEAVTLLAQLAKIEVLQAANFTQFIPEDGASAGAFFGPGSSGGFWFGV